MMAATLPSRRRVNAAGAAACALMMAFALYVQYGLRLMPCNLCILQRGAVIGLGLVFLLAALHDPGRIGARVYASLVALAATLGVLVSARHVWVQMQPPGSLPSCGADFYSMLEMMPVHEAIATVLRGGAECQTIQWTLFGLSMPVWVLIGVAALGLGGIAANLRLGRAAARPGPADGTRR
jgi:protein dithiol:quinone oxidoreductase